MNCFWDSTKIILLTISYPYRLEICLKESVKKKKKTSIYIYIWIIFNGKSFAILKQISSGKRTGKGTRPPDLIAVIYTECSNIMIALFSPFILLIKWGQMIKEIVDELPIYC